MLKDRISIQSEGIQITKDLSMGQRKAYYTKFSLESVQIETGMEIPVKYWDALNPDVIKIPNGTFVCVMEKEEDKIVDEFLFYKENGGKKPRLRWEIDSAPRYGEGAHKITLEWMDTVYENIHKKHIWMKNKKNGRKYSFLKEYIAPMDPGAKQKKDEYIIVLPPGIEVRDLVIEGDDLLLQKYLLIR